MTLHYSPVPYLERRLAYRVAGKMAHMPQGRKPNGVVVIIVCVVVAWALLKMAA